MTKVLILDPCYHKKGGHHHDVNVCLAQRLSHLDLSILADEQLKTTDAEDDFRDSQINIMTSRDMGYISERQYSTVTGFYALGREFALQLNHLEYNVVVAHTLMHFHLMGLAIRLHKTPPTKIIISQMFSPFEGLRSSPNNKLDFYFTMKALRCLNEACIRRSHHVTIGITSEYHWELYKESQQKYTLLEFQRCPWVVGYHNGNILSKQRVESQASTASKKRVVLYLGDAKEDKGIFYVRDFVSYLKNISNSDKISLVQQFEFYISIGSVDEWLKPLVDEIENLCNANSNLVSFQRRRLTKSELATVLSTSRAIVWLYDPIKYQYRSSGIFFEALSASYHNQKDPYLVLTQGSWMQLEADFLGLNYCSINIGNAGWEDSFLGKLRSIPVRAPAEPFRLQVVEQYVAEDFSSWVIDKISLNDQNTTNYVARSMKQASTLVISTKYPHFSTLSGPTGFTRYLDNLIELKSGLGMSSDFDFVRSFIGLKSATDSALTIERELLKLINSWRGDILCVDGEHCGSLLGKVIELGRTSTTCHVFAWFHQPVSVLREKIIDPSRFPVKGIRPICISPCQVEFFETDLKYKKDTIPVVPHGIHKHLLNIGQVSFRSRFTNGIMPVSGSIRFLTVGSWQRDHNLLLKTARAYPQHQFLWISSGLTLNPQELHDVSEIKNLEIRSHGISNHELFQAYHCSDVLFQPLLSATANNAILEAMAHGLPVITRDLASTRWYLGGNATFYTDEKTCWECINTICSASADDLRSMGERLLQQAAGYEWSRIADMFRSVMGSSRILD